MVEEISGQKYEATGGKISGGVLRKLRILEHSIIFIFLTISLMIFPEVTNYLQTSPGSGSYFFPRIGEINQMHTYKGTSKKSLFLHKTPCVKSTAPSPLLLCQEKATEKYQFNNTRVGTLIVATIYLQLIQNRYMFRVLLSFNVVTSIVYNPLPAMWKS